jgi:hypothetical protein
MSVCNPYLVSCPFELTTSGEINMWDTLPLDIRKKILQDVHSSFTMETTSKVEVPYDLLPDDQRDAMKLQMKLQIPVKLKMNFVKKMRVDDFTTEFEITLSQTLNEEPIKFDESLKDVCKRLQIDKQVLYTRIQDIKTWSRISKIKGVENTSRENTLHFIHKTTNSIDRVPGYWKLNLKSMREFFGEGFVFHPYNPNNRLTKKETRNEQRNRKKWEKRKKRPVYL